MVDIHNENVIHDQHSLLQRFQHYLSEFVYRGIDGGAITTFAVVSGGVVVALVAFFVGDFIEQLVIN